MTIVIGMKFTDDNGDEWECLEPVPDKWAWFIRRPIGRWLLFFTRYQVAVAQEDTINSFLTRPGRSRRLRSVPMN